MSWRVVVAFIVVFVLGGVIGGVCALRYAPVPAAQRPPSRPEQFDAQLMRRWMNSSQLDLTPEQRRQIRPIVLEAAESSRRLRRDTFHSEQLIIEHMQDAIAALLTPDQRQKFQLMIEQRRERMQKFIQEQQGRAQEQQRRLRQAVPPP